MGLTIIFLIPLISYNPANNHIFQFPTFIEQNFINCVFSNRRDNDGEGGARVIQKHG
jgi:hypothetical protein